MVPRLTTVCLPCRHAATFGTVPGVVVSVSANSERMGGPSSGCGTGRLGLQACLLWLVLGIPHDSPGADKFSWAWEQLCVLTT